MVECDLQMDRTVSRPPVFIALRSDQESWDVSGWPVGMHFLNIEGTSDLHLHCHPRVLVTQFFLLLRPTDAASAQ